MFASTNLFLATRHSLISVDSAPGACPDPIRALKSPHYLLAPRHHPRTTQLLLSFSTPGRHGPHTNARNSFPLYALLHTSRHTPGRGSRSSSPRLEAHPAPPPASSPNRFNATLTSLPANTHSKALTRKLSPLDKAFTKNLGEGPTRSLLFPNLVTSLRHYVLTSNSLNYSLSKYHDS